MAEVPTATSLKDIYTDDAVESQVVRWESLLADFKKEYGHSADFVSRSPGRLNIIGEHIDYSLYEVLPMAITADVLLAVKTTPTTGTSKITIGNVHSKFPKREFDVPANGDIEIDSSSLEWSNYFKAGLKGAAGLLREKYGEYKAVDMEILADGNVPAGGGLSSSAAFCCASALAALRAASEEVITKKELTELAIVSERAVGVNSGGMDQSASVFGQRGSALYVSFKPELQATPITFPTSEEIVFVVAQSFVQADKHTTGPIHYNLRVVECTLAAVLLAKIFRLKELHPDSSPLGVSLRTVQDAFFEQRGLAADNETTDDMLFATQLEKMTQLVEDYILQEEGYSREELSEILGLTIEELEEKFMSKFPVRAERFMLRQRALHVFREALRVIRFKSLLDNPPAENLLKELGSLMNDTQDSCRDVYQCSCPELDELCQLARGAGSYGSRLTGAGWGGCSVHLVPKDKVEKISQVWIEKYYKKKWPDISEEKLKDAIVVSKPSSGSFLFEIVGDNVV